MTNTEYLMQEFGISEEKAKEVSEKMKELAHHRHHDREHDGVGSEEKAEDFILEGTEKIQTVRAMIADLHCNGCGKNCSLMSPGCGRGRAGGGGTACAGTPGEDRRRDYGEGGDRDPGFIKTEVCSMKKTVNALGDTCPIPVVKTKNAIRELDGPGVVETLVDNEISVQNLTKMANQKGYKVRSEKIADDQFRVTMEIGKGAAAEADDIPEECLVPENRKKNIVVAVTSAVMGTGNDELGAVLMKGFLYALTQQDVLPSTVLFYNGGATITTEGSQSIEDLKSLEALGVEILTCGTCLNYYKLADKLQVGGVTNMYEIAEKLTGADLVVRP